MGVNADRRRGGGCQLRVRCVAPSVRVADLRATPWAQGAARLISIKDQRKANMAQPPQMRQCLYGEPDASLGQPPVCSGRDGRARLAPRAASLNAGMEILTTVTRRAQGATSCPQAYLAVPSVPAADQLSQ